MIFAEIWPPYRMDAEQLKRAIHDRSPAVQHDEFLQCVIQTCDSELLELLLNSDDTVIARLETGNELTCLRVPISFRKLLERGLDPTRRNWRGGTLIEVFRESGNDVLENVVKKLRDPTH